MMRLFIYIFFIVIFSFKLNAEIINKIEIEGNNRISNSNIILFGKIELNENYDNNKINRTLKNLYETDFFEKINISIKNNILIIKVQENPIIQSIEITGVKNKTVLELLKDNLILKEKNPFVENKVRRDEIKLKNILTNYSCEIIPKDLDASKIVCEYEYILGAGSSVMSDALNYCNYAKVFGMLNLGNQICKDPSVKVLLGDSNEFKSGIIWIEDHKNLNEMTESLSNSVSSIENMSTEIRDSVKQSIKETNDMLINQIKGLDEQMQKEVTKIVEIMGSNLASLSEKFVSDYSPLTNQLVNLVNSLGSVKKKTNKKPE